MPDTTINKGLLLTRNSLDRNNSTELQYWVTTDKGPVLLRIANQKPVFFVSQSQLANVEAGLRKSFPACSVKLLELKTFSGESVSAIYNSTIHQHYRCQDFLKQAGVIVHEGDVRLHDRYLMERFICAGIEFSGEPVSRGSHLEYHNTRLKPCDCQANLRVLSLDIECDLDESLFSVGLSSDNYQCVLMIGQKETDVTQSILWCGDETALLTRLRDEIVEFDPDVISGWNLINFDLRILLKRANLHSVRFSIGRAGEIPKWRELRGETDKGFVWIPGRVAIDGIDALKTATYNFPSFSLENVAQSLLGRGKKVAHGVNQRIEEIRHNFRFNKPQLAAYNLEDCKLVEALFEQTRIMDFLLLRSQITGLELDRVGGMVAAFSNLYLPRLHRGGYVAPNLQSESGPGSPGGYVMDSRPGLYDNVLVLDFKSLYPSIIRTFKIDPMGMIEGLANPEDSIEGFRGARFHRTRHFLPEIITELWQQRDIAKRQNDGVRSQAIKILMNSFYGVLGTNGCRFYDSRLTSSITMRGHEIMQTTQQWIEDLGYTVIYGDTDSIFVWVEDKMDFDEYREIGIRLQTEMNKKWQLRLQQAFNLDCQLELEFETHFSRFLMPTVRGSDAGSKKRYAGTIGTGDSEKLVFKGLETVRTDWTALAREFQTTLFQMVFHQQDPTEFITEIVDETLGGKRDEDLVYRKQLRRKLNLYVKNVPPHVKAARLADARNEKLGKPLRYQNKGWVAYLLTVNGPEPAEYRESPIDYQLYVEKQLKPVADGILPFINMDFDSIISRQSEIF